MTDIDTIFLIACDNNYLDIIRCIDLNEVDNSENIKQAMDIIIKNNYIDLLDYLHSNKLISYCDEYIYTIIDYNNINILNWFVNNKFNINHNKGICYAANNNKLDILNWFHNNGFKFDINYYKYSIIDACYKLDFTIVFWFRDNGYLDEFYEEVIKKNKDWINKYGLNYHACSILNWFANNYDY